MGKQYKALSPSDIEFIQKQKLFYIASSSNHEVNLSPRGYDCLHVLDSGSIYMIDYLGSGNRTARDIEEDGNITLLFNAFEGKPKILRCFCKGELISKQTDMFKTIGDYFKEEMNTIRHIFKFNIYAVESSCGMGVPIMHYQEDRKGVPEYALKMVKEGKFEQYVQDHITPPDLSKV